MKREREPDATLQQTDEDHHPEGGSLRNDVFLIVFLVGLLLLNLTGVFLQIFGLDTALLITLVGSYGIFWNSLKRLTKGRFDGDLAVTIGKSGCVMARRISTGCPALFHPSRG